MSPMGQRTFSLERRWPFIFILLLSFCIIFGAAFLVGYNSHTRAKDAAIAVNGTRAALLARLILEHQRATIGVLQSYARQPLLIDAIKRKDFEVALRHLADLAKNNPEVEWPYITNPDSTVWVNFPVDKGVFNKDLSGRDWYKGISREWKPYISSVYKMVVGEKDLAVTVCAPVFDEKGKLIGILGAAQSTAHFRKIIGEVSSSSDIYLTLIDQEGHIICSNRFPYTKEVTDYPPLDFVGKARKGEKGDVEIQGSYNGNRGKYVSFAPIEGVGWSVIVEKGKSEVLRSGYPYFALIAAISFLTFAVVVLSLVYLRTRQRQLRGMERINEELEGRVRERTAEIEARNQSLNGEITERKKAEGRLRESEERWATTLASIGDAVIATDTAGRITFMNAVAEELTGWSLREAIQQPVPEVFHIINEYTRQKVDDPVSKVLKEGVIVGLANHTVLVRKDGNEVPIDDSGAPISGKDGKVSGVVLIFRDITERKRAEATLREGEERLRFALETSHTGAWDLDLVNHTAHRSLQHDRIFGYEQPLPQWTYEMFLDHVLPEDRGAVDAKFRKAIESQGEWGFECRIRRSDGEIRWIWAAGRHRKDTAGQVWRMVGIVQDITERKRADEALRQNREDQDRAQEVGQIGSWRMDVRRNVLTWSDENHRIFGVPKGTPLTYETFLGVVHPEDRQYVNTKWQAGLRGEPYDLEHRIVVGQQVKWVREKAYLEFDDAGKLMGGFGITQDISERKRAESQLRESEQGLSALYFSMTEGVAQHELIYDSGGQVIDYVIRAVNPAFETITGMSKDIVVNKKASEIYGTGNAPYLDTYSRVALSRQAVSFETYFPPMEKYFHISVFSPAQGKFATVFEDITERKRTEEALKESEEKYRLLVEHAPSAIYEIDFIQKRIKTVNEAASKMLGFTVPEILAMNPMEILDPDSRPTFLDRLRKAQAGEALSEAFEYKGKRKDGSELWGILHSKFKYLNGKIVGAFVVAHDITERKRAADILRTTVQRFFTVLSSMYAGILLVADNGRIEFANQAFCDLFDLKGSAAELTGLTSAETIERIKNAYLRPNEEVTRIREIIGQGQPVKGEEVAMRGDRTILRDFIPIYVDGKPFGRLWVHLEITERKRAEEALEKMREVLSEGQRIAHLGTFEYVADTQTTVWSEEEYRIYGLDPSGPSPAYDIMLAKSIHPDDAMLLHKTFMAAMESGSVYELEHRIVRPDGGVRWVYDCAHPYFDQNGKLIRYVGATLDITERRQAEEGLRKAKEELELRVQERTEDLAKSHHRLQLLASQLLLAQEKERKRVAVELHDGLLSELAASKMLFEGKLILLEQGRLSDLSEFKKVSDILAMVMKEARGIMNNLHPSVLDELGLIAAMNWSCGEYQGSYPHIKVETKIGVTEGDISESIRVVIYRVLQEALNNFAKHGKGDRVELSLSKSDGTFSLVIRDNGQGFDVEAAQKGMGLESMRERVELSGGEFQIESVIGQGTTIRAIWSSS